MKVMVLIKANADSEAGVLPSEALLGKMMQFNEMLVNKGIMVAGEGLQSSRLGKRVRFETGKKPVVLDGPFAETKELLAGFWIWQVDSMEQAVELVKQIPEPDPTESPASVTSEVEVRQVFEMEDFGENATPELRELEARLRAETDRKG